ncbi:hypothetical protein PG993_013800 [Apiospora rasikravindrae]|uniref:Uncharacterized protein n=1 Tax=Apiospora rasikravindrae TaxID=990691 RepID=A0ABR1RR76_9PEZI
MNYAYRNADHFSNMTNGFQSMRRVSRKQHLMHYLKVSRQQLQSRDAHQYLWARDDFVNKGCDTVHQWFESILYSTGPWIQRTLCILIACFYKREKTRYPAPDGTGGEMVEYRVRVRLL